MRGRVHPMSDSAAPVLPHRDGERAVLLRIPAKAEYIALCRLALTGLGRVREIGDDTMADLKLALTANNGNSGSADDNVDTVSVIDLEATPPRVIDQVAVGDGPEGFAISPTGKIAVAILLRGSNAPKSAFFHHRNGSVAVLKIGGKKVTKVGEVEVRGLPEGAVFSPDGKYLYVGNYMDDDISILKVNGTTVTNTGKLVKLPGHPASMRSVVP